jgi:divalent metal cation (Fe/Co/Zn/Cd) transporter
MKNWKTNLAALIVAGIGIATAMHWITPEVGTAIVTIVTAIGFGVAKDSNVTGGNVEQ